MALWISVLSMMNAARFLSPIDASVEAATRSAILSDNDFMIFPRTLNLNFPVFYGHRSALTLYCSQFPLTDTSRYIELIMSELLGDRNRR